MVASANTVNCKYNDTASLAHAIMEFQLEIRWGKICNTLSLGSKIFITYSYSLMAQCLKTQAIAQGSSKKASFEELALVEKKAHKI